MLGEKKANMPQMQAIEIVGNYLHELRDHPSLEIASVDDEAVYIKNTERDFIWRVEAAALLEYDWKDLEPVLLCKRESIVLVHMTRIVGYFSPANKSWNKSKLGELADRQRAVEYYQVPDG